MSKGKVFAFCVHQFCPKRPSRVCFKEGCNNELAGIETIRCSVCKRKICKLHRTNASRIMWSGFFFEIFPLESYFSNGTYYSFRIWKWRFSIRKKCFKRKIFSDRKTIFIKYGLFFRQNHFFLVWNFFHATNTTLEYDFSD